MKGQTVSKTILSVENRWEVIFKGNGVHLLGVPLETPYFGICTGERLLPNIYCLLPLPMILDRKVPTAFTNGFRPESAHCPLLTASCLHQWFWTGTCSLSNTCCLLPLPMVLDMKMHFPFFLPPTIIVNRVSDSLYGDPISFFFLSFLANP